jgi:hypothetical protein
MKIVLMMALSLSTVPALACRLTTPIELNTLLLEKQREIFTQVESTPPLNELIDFNQLSQPYPITLNLSYTKLTEFDHDANTIGARLSFNDTVHSFGLSDTYINSSLERSVNHTNGNIVHSAADTAFDKPNMRSVVTIIGGKIIAIEIFDIASKKETCVTKALR